MTYKGDYESPLVNAGTPISTSLAAALRAYDVAFGHPVPVEIIDKYVDRCGPLLLEIRQAVALRQPVQAWLARSKALSSPP
jgi:hypothetical protein